MKIEENFITKQEFRKKELNKTKKEYKTPTLSHLGDMKEITRYDVSVIVN